MTTKFYKAKISIQKEIEISVTAGDEEQAKKKAINTATKQNSGFNFSLISMALDSETEYKIGSKVKHVIFGTGEVTDIQKMSNGAGETCFSLAILFSNGDKKTISTGFLEKGKLEIIE